MLNFSCKELSFLSSYLGRVSSYIQAFNLATLDGFLATYRRHLATGCFPELAAVLLVRVRLIARVFVKLVLSFWSLIANLVWSFIFAY